MTTNRRSGIRAAALAAALAAVVLALAPTSGNAARAVDPQTPEQAAAAICTQAQTVMGGMFGTLVGSMATCQAKALAIVKDSIEKCKTAADQQACVQAAIQQAFVTLAAGGGGGAGDALTEQALVQACTQLQARMGARFVKTFGSLAGCKEKVKPDIEKIIADAQAACSGAGDPASCITSRAASAEAVLVGKFGGGASTAEIAAEIADEVCTRLQAELGDRFAAKYGSLASCKTQMAAKAGPLAKDAGVKCKAAADIEVCITEQINSKTDALSESLGAGPTVADVTDEIAEQVCGRLRVELGANFAKKFGSVAACAVKVKAASESFAAEALAACAKAADRATCTRTKIEAGTAALQDALGAGPTTDEITDDIGDQACARIKSELGDRFARKYPSLAACKAAVKTASAAEVKAALARCQKASNATACSEQAIRDIADRLTTQLAGPTEDDVTAEVVEQACARIKSSLDAKEYAARFRDDRGCASLILMDAVKVAQQSLATCKKAADRGACIEKATTDATAALTTRFAATALDATELADRLGTEACRAVQGKVSASDFGKAFGGLTGCKRSVAADATNAAGQTVRTCSVGAPAGRATCAERELRSAATVIEARLRANVKFLPSQVDSIATQVLDQTCQAASAQLGSLLAGGVAGCKTRATGDARAVAYAALDACKGVEACVRSSLPARAEALRLRLFPIPSDPTLDSIAFEIGRSACAGQHDNVVNKQRRSSDWLRAFGSDRLSACTTWAAPLSLQAARQAAASCSKVRPADARKHCYEDGAKQGALKLRPALDLVTVKMVVAAPAKKR